METLKLDIVTPDGNIFSNQVQSVTLPGSEGEFGVLPGHIGIVSALSAGAIEILKVDNTKELVAINWGYVKVDNDHVDVLVDGAVAIEGHDEGEIAKAIGDAKELLNASMNNKVAASMVISHIESSVKDSL